jgi:lipoprotein-releasing system permease protein
MATHAPYEWLIGTRYLRSAHRSGLVSFVASMSVIGLALAVAVLVVVLSVLNGFETELRGRMLAVTAHGTISGVSGQLPEWRRARSDVAAGPGVMAVAPYIEARGLLANGERVSGTMVRGILPEEERKASGLGGRMTAGSLDALAPGAYRVILGSALARELDASVGKSVVLMTPEGSATPAGFAPRMRRFVVAGVFDSGMYEYDRGLALVHLADAAKLYRFGDRVTGLRVALEDPFVAPQVMTAIAYSITTPGQLLVTDWTRDHVMFFRTIDLTKSMMFFILLTLIVVASINLVATLVMIVKEKQADIAILRTMGAAPVNVLRVFLVQGALIGLVGTLAGALLGWALALNVTGVVHGIERAFGVQFLDPSVYLMSDLPAEVRIGDVLRVSAVALLLAAVATIYPAWRASRTLPAQALRHE